MAGVILLAALVFAPWCWACTWPSGIHLLDLFLLAAAGLWLIGGLRPSSRLPRALMITVAAILIEGWAMALNSRSVWAAASGLFAPLPQPLAGWPGSVERDLSWEIMARVSAMMGATLIATALGKSRRWRGRIVATMVFTGVSIVLLGCWQRWTRAPDIFWNDTRHLDYFFATFRNVTNAGEYFNFLAPLAATLALRSAVQRKAPLKKAAAVCALAILLAGSFVCGSKIAPLLTAFLAVFFLSLQRDVLLQLQLRTKLLPVLCVILVLALGLIIQGSGLGVVSDRWHRFFDDAAGGGTWTNRLLMDRACLDAVPQAGAWGFGPGTFQAIFPSYQDTQAFPGFWIFAHNDYLQTWLEWGALGATAWSVYFFGAFYGLVRALCSNLAHTRDRTATAGLLVALIGIALMALVDFPLQIASIELNVAVVVGLGWSALRPNDWPVGGSRQTNPTTWRGSPDNRGARSPPAAAAGR